MKDRFIFASEMKAMMAYGLKQELNYEALLMYLGVELHPSPSNHFQ